MDEGLNLASINAEHSTANDEKVLGKKDETSANERPILIVIAGKPGSGKSTALSNIFGANFTHRYSASSVTDKIRRRSIDRNSVTLVVVDTPGLGARDIAMDQIKSQLTSLIGGLDFNMIYCQSVGPEGRLTDTDAAVVKNLQKALGNDIWKKCVVLFTFSDLLRSQECPNKADRVDYQGFLRDHARKLSRLLKEECGSHVPDVKTIFEVDRSQEFEIKDIVAVPVGRAPKERKEKHNLLLGERDDKKWKDIAFEEIMRKASPMDRLKLLNMAHGTASVSSAIAGGVLGAAIGGVAGAAVGLLAGGFGAVPGAVIGVVAGAAVGGVGSLSMAQAVLVRDLMVKRSKVDKLKDSEHMTYLENEESSVSPPSAASARENPQP